METKGTSYLTFCQSGIIVAQTYPLADVLLNRADTLNESPRVAGRRSSGEDRGAPESENDELPMSYEAYRGGGHTQRKREEYWIGTFLGR